MNLGGLVHARWLDHVAGLFGSTCAIQVRTDSVSGTGAVSSTWANVSGLTTIPCCVGSGARGEVQQGDRLLTYGLVEIALKGYYPAITTAHRCVVGATNYNILNVGRAVGNAYTSLTCQAVTG